MREIDAEGIDGLRSLTDLRSIDLEVRLISHADTLPLMHVRIRNSTGLPGAACPALECLGLG